MTITQHWRPTTTLRTGLIWLLSVDIAATVAFAVATSHRSSVVDEYYRGSASYSDAQHADTILGAVTVAFAVVFLATAVVFMVWQWRSAKNNELLGKIRPRYSPGWSIGGWFIPFANLVIPVRIMHDLWQGADPETRNYRDWRGLPRWSLIGWWWGCYLTGGILAARVVGQLASIAAAVLAILMVRSITDRQEAARQLPTATAPGWRADPTARFEYRYWDGTRWTDHVSRAGQVASDPIVEIG